MNLKEKILPGDILFYKVTPQSGWQSKIIAIAQFFRKEGTSPTSYSHVSLLDWNKNFQFESRWPKSRHSLIDWNSNIEVWRIKSATIGSIEIAIKWCQSHLNCWYDIGQIFFGLFSFKNTYSCTEFISQAYKSAGIDLIGDAGKFIGPNELLDTRLLERIK